MSSLTHSVAAFVTAAWRPAAGLSRSHPVWTFIVTTSVCSASRTKVKIILCNPTLFPGEGNVHPKPEICGEFLHMAPRWLRVSHLYSRDSTPMSSETGFWHTTWWPQEVRKPFQKKEMPVQTKHIWWSAMAWGCYLRFLQMKHPVYAVSWRMPCHLNDAIWQWQFCFARKRSEWTDKWKVINCRVFSTF